jgi:hypothetical protein
VFFLNVYVMHLVLQFITIIHTHLVSHLGALDEPREEHDGGAEPEDDVWRIYPEDGRTKRMLGPETSPGRCKLTELTCDRSQASPGAF